MLPGRAPCNVAGQTRILLKPLIARDTLIPVMLVAGLAKSNEGATR
jgi:hypothetical protein